LTTVFHSSGKFANIDIEIVPRTAISASQLEKRVVFEIFLEQLVAVIEAMIETERTSFKLKAKGGADDGYRNSYLSDC
jgi:hypothetical protein